MCNYIISYMSRSLFILGNISNDINIKVTKEKICYLKI